MANRRPGRINIQGNSVINTVGDLGERGAQRVQQSMGARAEGQTNAVRRVRETTMQGLQARNERFRNSQQNNGRG